MPFLIYSLFGISVFKLIVDAMSGNLLANYSIFLEGIQYAFLLSIIIRTSVKKSQAPREKLMERIEDLKSEVEREEV